MSKLRFIVAELSDIAIVLIACSLIIAVTFVGVMFGEWIANIFYRAGDTSSAASWIAHAVALMLTLGVIFSIGGRIVNQSWWFHE